MGIVEIGSQQWQQSPRLLVTNIIGAFFETRERSFIHVHSAPYLYEAFVLCIQEGVLRTYLRQTVHNKALGPFVGAIHTNLHVL
jgi:hypothetical protein